MGRHPEDRTAPGARTGEPADTGRGRPGVQRAGRARRHLLVAGFVLGYERANYIKTLASHSAQGTRR